MHISDVSQMNSNIKKKSKTNKKVAFFREGYWELYLILLIPFLFLVLFKYIPILGIIMAFQDFSIFDGFLKSKFVGFQQFEKIFTNSGFMRVLWNTIFINAYKLLFWIPIPVILAIFINEVKNVTIKKIIQTTIYLPHFLSWVVVGGIFSGLLAVNGGLVNGVITSLGFEPIKFMYDNKVFIHVIVSSAMWKEVGFGSIVYLGAITAIDSQMYEAAVIDGASRIKQIWHITIPSLSGTIMVVLIMALGNLLNNSFEQMLIMYNPAVYDVSDVINTYVYRYGVEQMEYSYATAVGLFNGVVGFILVMAANTYSRKFLNRSLW